MYVVCGLNPVVNSLFLMHYQVPSNKLGVKCAINPTHYFSWPPALWTSMLKVFSKNQIGLESTKNIKMYRLRCWTPKTLYCKFQSCNPNDYSLPIHQIPGIQITQNHEKYHRNENESLVECRCTTHRYRMPSNTTCSTRKTLQPSGLWTQQSRHPLLPHSGGNCIALSIPTCPAPTNIRKITNAWRLVKAWPTVARMMHVAPSHHNFDLWINWATCVTITPLTTVSINIM